MKDKPTRRSFFVHAGATLAAPFAATATFAGEHKGAGYVARQRAALDDLNAIRVLQQRYVRLAGAGTAEAIAALFAVPARAAIETHLRSVVVDGDDTIAIASDGTATSRMPCIVTTATPIEGCGTLVEMARLQGDGFVARSERRVLASSFVKIDGLWKIERTEWIS